MKSLSNLCSDQGRGIVSGNGRIKSIVMFLLLMGLVLPSWATSGGNPPENAPSTKDAKESKGQSIEICPEPRPELCAMNYLPVCAQLQDGSFKTYANGCTSCTDPNVVGYRKDACEDGQ